MLRIRWIIAALLAAGIALCGAGIAAGEPLRIAVVTDVHAHDTDSPNEGKVMINYAERLAAFVDAASAWPADAVLELGDLANGRFVMGAPLGEPERIGPILADAWAILSAFDGPVLPVIGNHDVYDLDKDALRSILGLASTSYSVDLGAFHVVVLDAQYSKAGIDYENVSWMVQGTIPPSILTWLREDLAATDRPTIVCIHQPLDVDFSLLAGGPPISNHVAVRDVLAESGVVVAVLQGHTHESARSVIDGIHYLTFAALVDQTDPAPPSWAMITFDPAGRTIAVEGTGLQESYTLSWPGE